ncbi:helicase associated domain-containing protein [Arthrobacter globiformis]|uniref:helicase associated domain-containing protein n=1 Tax=Arthrobacter globiformis TaxID=1665 RepID=UPI00397BA66F
MVASSAAGISSRNPLPRSSGRPGRHPGWDQAPSQKAEAEARWQRRLKEVRAFRKATGELPRHQKTDDPLERTLGVWLHGQRINCNHGKLAPKKKLRLDKVLPGWREGRRRRGGHSRNS